MKKQIVQEMWLKGLAKIGLKGVYFSQRIVQEFILIHEKFWLICWTIEFLANNQRHNSLVNYAKTLTKGFSQPRMSNFGDYTI